MIAVTAAVLTLIGAGVAQADIFVAYSGANKIIQASDGGVVTNDKFIMSITPGVTGVASNDTYIYWANQNGGKVGRAKLDGTDVQQSFIAPGGTFGPYSVAVDSQYIYWGDLNRNAIGRAKLDGTEVQVDFITGVSSVTDVAVNANYIYFSRVGGKVGRATLDGVTKDINWITSASGGPYGVDVDDTYIYWTGFAGGTIQRALLDGTGQTSIVTGLTTPWFVVKHGDYLYWSNGSGNKVQRAKTDGTGFEPNFMNLGTGSPAGITFGNPVTPEPAFSADPASKDFGDQKVGTSSANQTFTVSNTGTADLIFDAEGVSLGNTTDFTLVSETCSGKTLPVGAPATTCAVTARFNPQTVGAKSTTIDFSDNTTAGTSTIDLDGTGLPNPAPTGLRVQFVLGAVQAVWQPMSGATAYRVTLTTTPRAGSSSTKTDVTTRTSATWRMMLKPGTRYEVCVRALMAGGLSRPTCAGGTVGTSAKASLDAAPAPLPVLQGRVRAR